MFPLLPLMVASVGAIWYLQKIRYDNLSDMDKALYKSRREAGLNWW